MASPGFFINEHHRAVFEIEYPKLYKFLMGPASNVKKMVPGNPLVEKRGSALAKQLQALGMYIKDDRIDKKGKKTYCKDSFQFGAKLGHPIRKKQKPCKSTYSGKELREMQLFSRTNRRN